MNYRRQQGYLLVVAVFLILVIGVMGSLIAYLTAGRARVAPAQLQGFKAFYIAESGLEIAARYLVGTGVSSPITCDNLTGASAVTNASVLEGTFTATAVNNALYTGTSSLSSGITANATTMTLDDVSGFAPHGRVRVGSEAIDYASISGTTLVGLTRGTSDTTAASHSSGLAVSQSVCLVDVQAGIPSVVSPQYRRQIQLAVEVLAGGGDTTAVGKRNGNNFSIIRWNNPTVDAWNDYSFNSSSREHLRGVAFASMTSGWAVGDERNKAFTMLNWNGATWLTYPVGAACGGQDLLGVAVVSANEAWAVGKKDPITCKKKDDDRYTILKWNGTNWTALAPNTIPADSDSNQDLYSISMRDTTGDGLANIGFAVGDSGRILEYDGTNFTQVSSPTSKRLRGVSVVSASEAWAVGNSGTILRWDGTSWSTVSSPTSKRLNAITMLDTNGDGLANVGWAVGNGGRILYYNGSTWTQQNAGGKNLYGVAAASATYAWAVGKDERTEFWDGTSWTSHSTPLSGTRDLNAVAITEAGAAATGSLVGSWQQVFR